MKSYAAPTTTIKWSPYGRQLFLDTISLPDAVAALRHSSFGGHMRSLPVYCWLDLNRKFGMAHTAKRQARCDRSELSNDAVVMELVVRNVAPNALATSTWAAIKVTILTPLRGLPRGPSWLDQLTSSSLRFSVADEVAFWTRHGIYTWVGQMQNLYADGIDDAL
ncbi:Aste57867_8701 [Aphanomyces stellatus]|uniref:Aste57867_8701 protein n=1 Tax=Aphanomyces stellatus TaxID=120398 RepID=A0A485KL13_9STRA|nr:hypothetical protein As57867_008667 [Aphanomyces stellatus]VFT85587.1 Aste57867_8701 [Aphanomyces stellatus]